MFKLTSVRHRISTAFLSLVLVNLLCSKLCVCGAATSQPCRYNCTLPYLPLCESDGKTYGNMCHLNTKNKCDNTRIHKVSGGTCPKQLCVPDMHPITCKCPCTKMCLANFDPVIGTDGVTYPNACSLAVRTACFGYPVRVCRKSSQPANSDPVVDA